MDDQTSEESMMVVQVHPNFQPHVLTSTQPAEIMLLLLTALRSPKI
jgi:hypothetical protein